MITCSPGYSVAGVVLTSIRSLRDVTCNVAPALISHLCAVGGWCRCGGANLMNWAHSTCRPQEKVIC